LAANASFNTIERRPPILTAKAGIPTVTKAAMKTARGLKAARAAGRFRRGLMCVVPALALSLLAAGTAFAENPWAKSGNAWGSKPNAWGSVPNAWGSVPNAWGSTPNAWGSNPNAWGRGPGYKEAIPSNSPGFVVVPSGAIVGNPAMVPHGVDYVDTGAIPDGLDVSKHAARRTRHAQSGAPPSSEKRLIEGEVLIELAGSPSQAAIEALQRRHHLSAIGSQALKLTGVIMYRWKIDGDKETVTAVIRALEANKAVASAQPNYTYSLLQDLPKPAAKDDIEQYAPAKLNVPRAHEMATGDNVLVAIIDTAIDQTHPDLAGAVAQSFDATGTSLAQRHGTAVASLIAGHGGLNGVAPGARILAAQAFAPNGDEAQGTTFSIVKAIDWAAANGARVINMGFGGPADPALRRSVAAANEKNIVLVAAAGDSGPKSPAIYPAADENVIAVAATDADDKLFPASSHGRYVALAAPGVDVRIATPGGSYALGSGTSYSAAEVSGMVALMLERQKGLTPQKVRAILQATARDLGPKGRDPMFGAGLADAYAALTAEESAHAQVAPAAIRRTGKR
jgi:subtilisin family serine protease